MGKAILGVVVGFVVWTVVWLGAGKAMAAAIPGAVADDGSISSPAVLGAVLALSVVCSLLAGVSCRAIAGPGRSVLILGIVLLLVGIGVQASAWQAMPLWYHLPFLLLIVPVTLLGGALLRRPGSLRAARAA